LKGIYVALAPALCSGQSLPIDQRKNDGARPLVARQSGGLGCGWLPSDQLKSRITECRLATVIFCFVTFVCTDHDLADVLRVASDLASSPSLEVNSKSNKVPVNQ